MYTRVTRRLIHKHRTKSIHDGERGVYIYIGVSLIFPKTPYNAVEFIFYDLAKNVCVTCGTVFAKMLLVEMARSPRSDLSQAWKHENVFNNTVFTYSGGQEEAPRFPLELFCRMQRQLCLGTSWGFGHEHLLQKVLLLQNQGQGQKQREARYAPRWRPRHRTWWDATHLLS